MAAVYFILGSLAIAESYFYLKLASSRHKLGLSVFIEGFSLWSKGFLARIWSKLWVFLWSLLFIIPGIVKLFAYSQMNFLLAEYPELGVGKAMQISVVITRGYKGNLFMLSLSFILWDILSLFTAGLLQFWIRPYKKMTYVNAYHFLVETQSELVPKTN